MTRISRIKNPTKLICLFLALIILGCIGIINTGAEEINTNGSRGNARATLTSASKTFRVAVPTVLPIIVDSDNNVTVSENARITNLSNAPVNITSVSVEAAQGWSLVEFDTDFTKRPVDIKQYGMQLQGEDAFTGVDASLFGVINGGDSAIIHYNGNVAIQSKAYDGLEIGQVVFTVGWAEAQEPESYTISRSGYAVTNTANLGNYYPNESKTESNEIIFKVREDNVVTVSSYNIENLVYQGDYDVLETAQHSKTFKLSSNFDVAVRHVSEPYVTDGYYTIDVSMQGDDEYCSVSATPNRINKLDTANRSSIAGSQYHIDPLNPDGSVTAYHYYLDLNNLPAGCVCLKATDYCGIDYPYAELAKQYDDEELYDILASLYDDHAYFDLWIIEGDYDTVYGNREEKVMIIIPQSDIFAEANYSYNGDYIPDMPIVIPTEDNTWDIP